MKHVEVLASKHWLHVPSETKTTGKCHWCPGTFTVVTVRLAFPQLSTKAMERFFIDRMERNTCLVVNHFI